MLPVRFFLNWLTSAVAFDTRTPADCLNAGNDAYSQGDFDSAIEHYNDAIAGDPANASYLANRGAAWHARGEYDRAIDDFTTAIRIDPKNLYAYPGRGSALLAKQEYMHAMVDFVKAIEHDPTDINSFSGLAFAYLGIKDYQGAFDILNESCQLVLDSPEALCVRGATWLWLLDNGRNVNGTYQLDRPIVKPAPGSKAEHGYRHAIADLAEAIRIQPDHAYAYHCRGAAWHVLGEFHSAIADYSEGIRLQPGDRLAYLNRGLAWRGLQEYAKAIVDFEEAQRIAPGDIWSLNALAWLLGSALEDKVRDGKRAIELATQVLTKEPTNPAWMDTLAVGYAEAGEFAHAIAIQEQAVHNAPALFQADLRLRLELYRQGKPYRQLNRSVEASAILDSYPAHGTVADV